MKDKNLLYQKVWNFQYGYISPFQLYNAAKGNKALVQKLKLQAKLPAHNGCVNTICWNENGEHLLSGSDDKHLCITNGYKYSVLNSIQTGHKTNIFSAKFLPGTGDKKIISCSGDGAIVYTDINNPDSSLGNIFKCHFGTAYEVLSVPSDSHTFLSCGEDGTVRWFDLRIKNRCSVEDCKEDILVNCWCAATSLAISPYTPYYLGVGCADGTVRIFDRRLLGTKATGSYTGSGIQAMVSRFTVPELEGRSHRITSLSYSPDGEEMLVSYSSDYIYLYEVKDCGVKEAKVLPKIGSKSSSKKSGTKSSCPVIRRLRVRGDWSDTGPSARPERESRASGQQPSLHTSLMQRMSDVLTRIFTGSSQSRTNTTSNNPSSSSPNESAPGTSENISEQVDSSSLPAATSDNEDKPCHSSSSLQKSSDSSQIPSSQDLLQNESSVLSECNLDKPSTSSCEPTRHSQSLEEKSNNDPGKVTMGQSLKNLQDELSYRRKDFLEKHNIEPVINLHYNGKGVNSGLITMDVTNTLEREQVDLPAEDDEQSVEESEERAPSTLNSNLENQVSSSTKEDKSNVSVPDHEISKVMSNPEPGMSCVSERDLDENAEKMSDSESKDECEEEEDDDDDEEDVESAVMDVSDEDEEETVDIRPTVSCSSRPKFSSSRNEEENLDDMEQEKVQMNSVPQPRIKTKFIGHRNARTMIKEATFWGNDFVMSGSDCGHIFIWDRYTTELVMILEADRHVVNCLQPHPFDPILASSGIDYDIKIWAPLQEEPFFDHLKAQEIVQRNEIMLEETRDTITVPASFMIRMLASLNHLRSSGGISGWRRAAREARNENVDSSS